MDSYIENEVETSTHYLHYFDAFMGSFALISPSISASRAVVFVHGFGGNAQGTWDEFHRMIDDPKRGPWFGDADLFFFQYSSVWERIQVSTNRFLTFLDEIVFNRDPSHFTIDLNPLSVLPDIQRSQTEPYKVPILGADRQYIDVILVGHSEGGVIVRNAIDKKSTGSSPILRCQLRLFAPAIGGYAPAGLLGVLANSPFFGRVLDSALRAAPAYQDLSGSQLLEKLRNKTEANARKRKAVPAFRAKILWGSKDFVVNPDKYEYDDEDVRDQSHTGICKPNSTYEDPLEWLP